MANRGTNELINKIIDEIKANGQGAITAPLLQTLLIDLVQSRGLVEKYVSTKTYQQNEFVSFNDNIYITNQEVSPGETPDTDPEKYDIQGSISSVSASDVNYTHPEFNTVDEALDDHDSKIGNLTPDEPVSLSGRDLSIDTYEAKESGSGTDHDCTDDDQPLATMTGVYDAASGTLTLEIDGADAGNIALTSGDDSGTYGSLVIVSEDDPYDGEIGQGFYQICDVNVSPSSTLTVGNHTYQLLHSITGNSNILSFYVDDPGAVTIDNIIINLPGSVGYVSGVPTLENGSVTNIDFTVNNAIRKHYNPVRLARLVAENISDNDIAPPATPPNENDDVIYTNQTVTIIDQIYTENLQISVSGFNSKDEEGASVDVGTSARIDTVSDESDRKIAGSGEFPSSGYGAGYDGSQDLKTTYTSELQQLNGKYQFPTGNYVANEPVAGPDYSSGMGTGYRYAIVTNPVSLTDVKQLEIEILDAENFSDEETTGLRLYVKVEGETGWLDANKAYNGGVPLNDGDGCMFFAESTANKKKIGFIEPVSGLMYVRIGLPDGSNKKFSGISINNIV